MSDDNLFKITFFSILIFMVITFASNIKHPSGPPPIPLMLPAPEETAVEAPAFIKRIKRLISEDKLSDKEALFYEPVKE